MACSSGNSGTVIATEGAGNVITFVPATDGYPFEDANGGEWSGSAWWIKEIHYDDGSVETLSRTDNHNQPNFITDVSFSTEYAASGSKLVITFTVDVDLIQSTISSILIGVAATSANQASETESDFCLFVNVASDYLYGTSDDYPSEDDELYRDILSVLSDNTPIEVISPTNFAGTGHYKFAGEVYYHASSGKIYWVSQDESAGQFAGVYRLGLFRSDPDGSNIEQVHNASGDNGTLGTLANPVFGTGDDFCWRLRENLYYDTIPISSPTLLYDSSTLVQGGCFDPDGNSIYILRGGFLEERSIPAFTLLQQRSSVNGSQIAYDTANDRVYFASTVGATVGVLRYAAANDLNGSLTTVIDDGGTDGGCAVFDIDQDAGKIYCRGVETPKDRQLFRYNLDGSGKETLISSSFKMQDWLTVVNT